MLSLRTLCEIALLRNKDIPLPECQPCCGKVVSMRKGQSVIPVNIQMLASQYRSIGDMLQDVVYQGSVNRSKHNVNGLLLVEAITI